jgi:hypothetical protein
MVAALLLASCITTQPAEEIAQAPPAQGVPHPQGPALSQQGPSAQAQLCRPGTYFCPGKVAGCCPNGWGCGSTSCIRPQASKPAVARACLPGYYFCPGEVAGCCPNGWGCTSTHCVRPGGPSGKRIQDL